jgi:hypothetical protein
MRKILNNRFESYNYKLKSQMEEASKSTAYAAWQASRLQEEKSKLEAKLA